MGLKSTNCIHQKILNSNVTDDIKITREEELFQLWKMLNHLNDCAVTGEMYLLN